MTTASGTTYRGGAMMGRALLIVGVMGTLGLIATGVLGYFLPGPGVTPEVQRHILAALASTLLLLFSHCWILFYLIGTGKAIKDTVREYGMDPALGEETKRSRRAYPYLLLAMGTAVATFILGGGAATGLMPSWIHHTLFYATLVFQTLALWIEKRVLDENERLMMDVDRRAGSAA